MPNVGDGTGNSGGGKEVEGLTYRDDKPENPAAPYKSFSQGRGGEMVKGGNTNTPFSPGSKS